MDEDTVTTTVPDLLGNTRRFYFEPCASLENAGNHIQLVDDPSAETNLVCSSFLANIRLSLENICCRHPVL